MPKQNGANGEHMVTMREVAKAAGVSIKTVSNVVNDYEFVSQATRDKVNKAIDELGYTLNMSARNLRRGQTGIIGLAIPDLQMPYFAQLSSLVIEEAKKLGLRVIVEPTQYSREGEIEALHGSQQTMIDGLIYSPLELDQDDVDQLDVDYPLVLVGERIFTDKVDHIATETWKVPSAPRRICCRPVASAWPWSACIRARRSAPPRCAIRATLRRWKRPASNSTSVWWSSRACGIVAMACA